MITATSSGAQGLQRKTLADQLDRLDKILDGLGEALTAAVAQAVTEGVAAAVTQLIRRPDLCRPADIGPSAAVLPTWRDRMRCACGWAAAWMCEASARTGRLVRRIWARATAKPRRQRMTEAVSAARQVLVKAAVQAGDGLAAALPAAWRRSHCLPAVVGMGLFVVVVGYLGGPWVEAAACGVLVMAFMIAVTDAWNRWAAPCPACPAPAATDTLVTAGVI